MRYDNDQSYKKTNVLQDKNDLIFNGLIRGKLYNHEMEFRVPLIVKDLIFDFFTDPLEDEFQDVIEKSDYHLISHVKCQNLGLLVDGFEVDSTLE